MPAIPASQCRLITTIAAARPWPGMAALPVRRLYTHSMANIKHLAIQSVIMFCFALPLLTQTDGGEAKTSKLEGLLWSLGPIAVISLLVFWLIRSATRGQKVQIDRYQQHMDRVRAVG